jgi:hypothetical protein
MWVFAFVAFAVDVIQFPNFFGVSISVAAILLMNVPLVLILRHFRNPGMARWSTVVTHGVQII